jgi:hypothetical protein
MRTSLAAKAALIAVAWSLDVKPAMVMIGPPNAWNTFAMRPSNPPRNVALCKSLESVAIAPQLLEEILPRGGVDGGNAFAFEIAATKGTVAGEAH